MSKFRVFMSYTDRSRSTGEVTGFSCGSELIKRFETVDLAVDAILSEADRDDAIYVRDIHSIQVVPA